MYYTIRQNPAPKTKGRSGAGTTWRASWNSALRNWRGGTSAGLRRGIERFQHFLERAWPAQTSRAAWTETPSWPPACSDIFEHSFHFADSLLRYRSCWMRLGSRFK